MSDYVPRHDLYALPEYDPAWLDAREKLVLRVRAREAQGQPVGQHRVADVPDGRAANGVSGRGRGVLTISSRDPWAVNSKWRD